MSVKVKDWKGEFCYLGPSKAIVIDNKDPNLKGRIRVNSPVYGATGFIHYLTPDDGFYSPPDIGSVVFVQADGGDPDYLIASSTVNDGNPSNPDTPTPFRRGVPTNRGWVSPGDLDGQGKVIALNGGHSLELDDGIAIADAQGTVTQTKESKGLRLKTSGGHFLKMWEEATDGAQQNRIELSTSKGQLLHLIDDDDSAKQQVILKDVDNRTIEIIKETDRIRIRNSSNTIHIDIDLANDTIEIDAEHVKLGTNAMQHIVRGDAFRDLFNAHYHQTGTGPSSPPVVPMDPNSADTHLSKRHTVE